MRSFYDLQVREYEPQDYEVKGHWIDNRFSNFKYLGHPVTYRNYTTKCLELPFQAAKNPDALVPDVLNPGNTKLVLWNDLVYKIGSPGRVRQIARPDRDGKCILPLREHYECQNLACMDMLLRQRWYPGTKDADWLFSRVRDDDEPIIEISNWKDTRWGVDSETFTGRNALGRLLSVIGNELVYTGTVAPGAPEEDWLKYQPDLIEKLNGINDGGIEV